MNDDVMWYGQYSCKRREWREEEVTFVLVIPRLIIYLLPIV